MPPPSSHDFAMATAANTLYTGIRQTKFLNQNGRGEKTGWKKWEDERCYGGSGGGRRKGRAFLYFCMFLDEMFDVLCLIFADVRRFSQICISAFPYFCLSACSLMFARRIS